MSLLGNLEDLGLGDILQIVSLSKKSGVLLLTARNRSGQVMFKDGRVVCATVSTIAGDLTELLVRSGGVPEATAKDARQVWDDLNHTQPLRQVLQKTYKVSPTLIDDAIREHIQSVTTELFSWTDGEFNFDLLDVDDVISRLPPAQRELVVAEGISPQFLAMEAARLMDESAGGTTGPAGAPAAPELGRVIPMKRPAVPVTPSRPTPPAPAPAAPARPAAPAASSTPAAPPAKAALPPLRSHVPVIVADDDKLTLNAMAASLRLRGFETHPADSVEGARTLVNEFESRSQFYIVLADLLMPRSDGAGILGGIELLEFVRAQPVPGPAVLFSDYENASAQQKAVELGASEFLHKPRKAEITRGAQSDAIVKFVAALEPRLARWIEEETGQPLPPLAAAPEPAPAQPPAQPAVPPSAPLSAPAKASASPDSLRDIGGEIAEEIGAEFKPAQKASSAGLSMLRQMSQELNNPESNIEITLLILRFAAELMSRAVIFLVTDRDIRGLGQFGLEIPGVNATRMVRSTLIPLKEPGALAEVAQSKTTFKGPLQPGKWNDYLVRQFGGFPVPEAFISPIVSRNRCVALLYGDNAPEGLPTGETEALEIFLVQAGMAMDRAVLERKLGELARAVPRSKG